MATEQQPVWRTLVKRAVESGDFSGLPLHFRAAVLARYLERPENKVLRSDSVGRLLRPGQPLLDFGIVDDAASDGGPLIHLRLGDVLRIVPERDRDHWLDHLEPPAFSRTAVQMQLTPAACLDDGEIREWRPGAA